MKLAGLGRNDPTMHGLIACMGILKFRNLSTTYSFSNMFHVSMQSIKGLVGCGYVGVWMWVWGENKQKHGKGRGK